MEKTQFATWKYQHPGKGLPLVQDPWRTALKVVGLSLGAAVLASMWWSPADAHPWLLFVPVVMLIAAFGSRKLLLLGPRYLLCGATVMYYANVARMVLDEQAGSLTLTSLSRQTFVLKRDKFPTGARKDFKIAKNKAAKFDKVSRNLIGRVLRKSPDVETEGIDRAKYESA